jgi:hypothetical protein
MKGVPNMDCCLCGNQIDVQHLPNGNVWLCGNSAQPVQEGRCCTQCTETIVMSKRYKAFDCGMVTYDGKKIPADPVEIKRQVMMSEGEEMDDEDNDIDNVWRD